MSNPQKYGPDFRERAVRLVFESRQPEESVKQAAYRVGTNLGANPGTVYNWAKAARTKPSSVSSPDSDPVARLAEVEAENAELRRANEILRLASTFFAAELDGQTVHSGATRRKKSLR